MCLFSRAGPSLKCLLSRSRTFYAPVKLFGGTIECRIKCFELYSHQRKTLNFSLQYCHGVVPAHLTLKRFKYTRKVEEDSSDSEDEVETVEDVGKDFKILKLRVNSLRADLILKAALGMARNKVEAAFFQSKIRVNGDILSKKSTQLKVEDEVDLERGPSKLNQDFLVVSRVKILSYSVKDDKYSVNAQCFRSLTIEKHPNGPWKSSE